jgi:hypothetical protein
MALSKQVKDSLLEQEVKKAEAFATPYRALAAQIKTVMDESASLQETARENRTTTWDIFKQALVIASEEGHTQLALRVGMEIACDQAGVPGGSFRSYLSTVVNLYEDIQEGNLSLKDAQDMTITAARALYRVVTPAQEARAALLEAVATWTPDEVMVLVAVTKGEADETEVEEVVEVAKVHHLQLVKAQEEAKSDDAGDQQVVQQDAQPARAAGGQRR